MNIEEARQLRNEIPENVYAEYGSHSGAMDSWLLLMILKELRELREEMKR